MLNDTLNTSEVVKKVKGKVTVELIDAKSGEVVEKQEKDNFIANNGIEYLQYLQRKNFKDQISQLGPAGADKDYEPFNPFEIIVLTDSVAATAPNDEMSVPGKMIGYSTKDTYSGPDTLRGTPNAGLCETSSTATKWVFDWPTQSANGVIGSVCWSRYRIPYGNFPTPSPVNRGTTLLTQKLTSISGRPIAYASSSLLFAGTTNTTVSKYDDQLSVIGSFTTINIKGIAWDDNNSKLWVISDTHIASYSQTGALIDGPTIITNRNYRGLTFDGTDLWTLVDWQVFRIASNGNDISNFDSYLGQLTTINLEGAHDISYNSATNQLEVACYGRYANYGSHSSHDIIHSFSMNGEASSLSIQLTPYFHGVQVNYHSVNGVADPQSYFDIIDTQHRLFLKNINNTYSSPSAYNIFIGPGWQLQTLRIDGMGSRALLPSPITKTSAQSLRITYQMDYS
jgi:hypothetical protein